ncbi:MAG: glycosyltransferase [Planctomycetota bacterium]
MHPVSRASGQSRDSLDAESLAMESSALAEPLDLSVVIPTFDEEANVGPVVAEVREVCEQLGLAHEILVVDGGSHDQTAARATASGARVILQTQPGYGAALTEAFAQTRGRFVVTLDSDLSHPPQILGTLYRHRDRAEILIASRYVAGGRATMPLSRLLLSRILNRVFAWFLDMPIADLSSGFRLYHANVLRSIATENRDFSFLQELLVKAYSAGYRVEEIPFHYVPRKHGYSKARILRFGISYVKLLRKSRRLRRRSLRA